MNKLLTEHRIFFSSSNNMNEIDEESIQLVVTSPPYPMIEMWDEIFSKQDKDIGVALNEKDSSKAFELMHQVLDEIWKEIYRVLMPGGIACINIGDATRKIGKEFRLYSNHSRILSSFLNLGFSNLPNILWRKPTNSPTKFMGSGMLPPGAYVTLEHEYILIFRKGNIREFKSEEEKHMRRESAFFWEERNKWFSDIWELRGTSQKMNNGELRARSAAFPFDIVYRLINMFSVKSDNILDPFLGTGTTTLAAITSARNSYGYELDESLINSRIKNNNESDMQDLNNVIRQRFVDHLKFVSDYQDRKGINCFKHENVNYNFPVMTAQEKEIVINYLSNINSNKYYFRVEYFNESMIDYMGRDTLFG